MRHVFVGIACLAACGGSHHRAPLAEVPIEYPPASTGDINVPDPPRPTATDVSKESVAARAHGLMTRGNNVGARALLEPRVFGGNATAEEISMLRGICKAQHDNPCIARIPAAKK
jgi:hypothetical protein